MNIYKCLVSITYTAAALVLMSLLLALTVGTIKPTQPSIPPKDLATGQIEAVLSELAMCESGGDDKAVNWDDGAPGLHSKGLLQFQHPTFRHEWRRLINKDIEDEEIYNLWTDPEAQTQLATAMLTESPKNLRHWKICTRKHNLYSKLTYAPQ